ncbi:MAG: EAL domain-containing protein [Sphingomonadaceae bacterium]|nr:EAL domain-containing protein [Sphingomonadaceae bacterium]
MSGKNARREHDNPSLDEGCARAPGGGSEPGIPGNYARQRSNPGVARIGVLSSEDSIHSLIGRDWAFTGIAIFAAVLATFLLAGANPGLLVCGITFLAIVVVLASRPLLSFEYAYADTPVKRLPFMLVAVGSPMFFFGLAMNLWSLAVPDKSILIMSTALPVVVIVAIATLKGRLPSILAVLGGVASGVTVMAAPSASLTICICSVIGEIILANRHAKRMQVEENGRIEKERIQQRAESLLSEYEQTGHGWFWETDRRGLITYVSPRIAKSLGSDGQSLLGRPFIAIFHLDSAEKESERTLKFHLSTRSSFQELPVRAATGEKEERWWSISGRPVMDQYNNFLGFRGSGTDLTETRLSQQHVTQLARFDSLTKLANRFQMAEWLEKILDAPQEERRACSIFMLDLDRFKHVNDTMGHPAGDALLRQVADRLRSNVTGSGSVGRLGGDEFQVILPGRHKHDELAEIAHRIIENLSQPYSIDGSRVIIGASVGISVCPDHGTNSEELIRNADLALYAAKDGGRGCYHFYAEDLHSEAEARRLLEQDLRDAISQGDLELHYQPQVSTTTEMISGFEALLRWDHPEHGYLSPAKFIPIAEEAGLVTQIGEWALRTACDQLAQWPEGVRIAVNVSPLQFANPSFPAIITSAIASAQIDPSRLELEITESVFLNDDRSTDAMFAALRGIGVRFALDDFGTGYSSLGYLKKTPFDKIKIDQSFVSGATIKGSRNGAIISSIVRLAEALDMETTAEGVETLDELELIRALGCSHIQGFIYEKALTADEAGERLSSGLTATAQGPQSARVPRQTMFRKVQLENGGHRYNGTIRNVSAKGALIEGLWNVPTGTVFDLHFSRDYVVKATARWSREDRMGVEFAKPLELDENGAVLFVLPVKRAESGESRLLRKAG